MLVVGRQKQRQKQRQKKKIGGGGGNKLCPSHGEQFSRGILNSGKKNGCIKKKITSHVEVQYSIVPLGSQISYYTINCDLLYK